MYASFKIGESSYPWMDDALCVKYLSIFNLDRSIDHAAQRSVCSRCPVIEDCLEYVVKTEYRKTVRLSFVYANLSPTQREKLYSEMRKNGNHPMFAKIKDLDPQWL